MAPAISAVGCLPNYSCLRICTSPSSSSSSNSRIRCWRIIPPFSAKLEHFPNSLYSSSNDATASIAGGEIFERRKVLFLSAIGFLVGRFQQTVEDGVAVASEFADMPALRGKDYGKTKMRYPDYTETGSGLQYKDLRAGGGPTPKMGETVVVDWDGYTIGYYGRIFEARNKTKGGSFEGDDKDFFKFTLGSQQNHSSTRVGISRE